MQENTLQPLCLIVSIGPNDFVQISSSNNPLVPFTADLSTHKQCFNVTIIDDNLLEDSERFNLSLSLMVSDVPVIILPDISEIEIVDEDCKTD